MILIFSLLLFSLASAQTAQPAKPKAVKGYDENDQVIPYFPSKKGVSPDTRSNKVVKDNNTLNLVIERKYVKDTIFFESFSNKKLENTWLNNSGIDNIIGYNDSKMGKVLKISNKHEGYSFLEFNFSNKINGKKIKLEGLIKTENIIKGEDTSDIGQLVLKFQVNNKSVYEAVPNLKGTKDWQKYKAHEDKTTEIDDANMGSYIFHVPKDAKNVTLYLGLQNCTGTIYFKDVLIVEIAETEQ